MKKNFSRRKILIYAFFLSIAKTIKAETGCIATPFQAIGPFYKEPKKKPNNDMTNNGKALGKKIKVYGQIFNKNCKPVKSARIDIWQANSLGKYNHEKDYSQSKLDKNFYGYLRLTTDNKGKYSFISIYPGSYRVSKHIVRTPHIHFKVTTSKKLLITQMYFSDDKNNKNVT